ncbi:cytoplasmic 60S subunit biogenesis factor ZNF622 [Sorex fumeus]|uniref:cytoplasmic 60S subunit biogenesis factor ZNF622 n=1 Tax=Sorex fumeus TaxID=62283 RepID=UPI0024ACEF96|nr:cytoplasmic 60S subunit biogenesis factor ZNF622 [Sorex fumeus]
MATAAAAYTCITCRLAFGDAELQRAHYKTDWHRYNLRRKVAALAPVSAEGFRERVCAQRAPAEPPGRAGPTYCAACAKRFASRNAYENHLRSRRHRELEARAVRAVTRRLQRLQEKSLEKGLPAGPGAGRDAVNAAIQRAVAAQPSPGRAAPDAERDPPPRLRWFERQARRWARRRAEDAEDAEDADGDDWEDLDSEEELECDDADDLDDSEEEEEEEDEETGGSPPLGAIPVTDCLFCSHHSSSLMKNVAHMTKVHSFFIPDIEYLSDLRGLIKYLGEKVGVGKICLWCNEKGKSFYSTEAVQAHMKDKSHCKLFTDGDAALEFADFYDFRSSYPDHKEGEDPDETAELSPEKNLEYDDETMELVLPSGARVGHRSLMRYYKQRFGVTRAVAVAKNQKAVGRVLRQYRALGWTGGTGAALARERDMQYVQRMKSKWMLKTGMKNNATKQMHFRVQVRF